MWPYFCKHDFLKNGIRSRFSKYKRMICNISLTNWFWAKAKWTHLYLMEHNCKFTHKSCWENWYFESHHLYSCSPNLLRVTRPLLFGHSHAQNPTGSYTWLEEAMTKQPQWQVPLSKTISFRVLHTHQGALVPQSDSGRNVKVIFGLFIWLCPLCLKSSSSIDTMAHSLTSLRSLDCHLLKEDFPDHLFYIATPLPPNP